MPVRRVLLAVALTVSATGLVACGSGTAASPAKGSSAAAGFSDADVTFLQSMIPHHEQAIEMAEMALDPKAKARPEVVALARRVQAGQDPEIAQMKTWLTAWGKPVQMDMSGGHDMSKMDGMMSAADMKALGAASGPAFDQQWLAMMVAHHQGALAMAEGVATKGRNAEVAALAAQVIAAQQAEITEMNGLLRT